MTIKALTVYEPWASLIALGEKKIETRGWYTKYRGPLAIHAAKKYPGDIVFQEPFYSALSPLHDGDGIMFPGPCIIAVAELVNCWYIVHHPGTNVDRAKHISIGAESLTTDKHAPDFADYIVPTEQEMLFGDWTPGRYAWQLENVHRLAEPIPAKGRQRIWNWDATEHLVWFDPYVVGSDQIWTPQGILTGQVAPEGTEDAVQGLQVMGVTA
mgnify:CR=1 FL=1